MGNGKIDVLASEGSHGTTVWFEQGNSWQDWEKHHIYSIDNQPSEGILAPVVEQEPNQGAWLYYEFAHGQFEPHILRNLDYTHPMEDRIMLYDLTDDGQSEIFIPVSGPDIDVLHILRISRDWTED